MNKKLLTLAVGAALAGGTALAHAEATVYGHFHVSIDSLDNGGTDSTTVGGVLAKGIFVSDNASRFGVKGSEDLGGGMKALFQVENAFRTDGVAGPGTTSSGSVASRNTYAGLAGDFGAVLVGRHDTPMKIVGRAVDLFNEQVGDARNVTNNQGSEDLRPNNVIAYASPNMSGLSILAAYLPEDGLKDASATSFNVTYSAGPLWVGFANEILGKAITATAACIAATSCESQSGSRIAGKYTAGDLTVGALWQSFNNVGGVKDVKNKAMGVSAAFKAGNNTFKVQYYTLPESVSSAKDGGKLMALGADHAFSKNTTGYIAYASASNETAGMVPAAVSTVATNSTASGHGEGSVTKGKDGTALSVGLVVNF